MNEETKKEEKVVAKQPEKIKYHVSPADEIAPKKAQKEGEIVYHVSN